jgi:hypothetical protein
MKIETYSSQQELLEKVEFYLTHEKERREIALRALERYPSVATCHWRKFQTCEDLAKPPEFSVSCCSLNHPNLQFSAGTAGEG